MTHWLWAMLALRLAATIIFPFGVIFLPGF
jgi:hypothetical protein